MNIISKNWEFVKFDSEQLFCKVILLINSCSYYFTFDVVLRKTVLPANNTNGVGLSILRVGNPIAET
jgi:hypothetical protein